MWRRFDFIKLLTTKNINFVSGPPRRPADPDGVWSVVGNIPGQASVIAAKDQTIIIVPITDIKKIGRFDSETYLKKIKEIKRKPKEDTENGQEE
jgi:hypothetical protein